MPYLEHVKEATLLFMSKLNLTESAWLIFFGVFLAFTNSNYSELIKFMHIDHGTRYGST